MNLGEALLRGDVHWLWDHWREANPFAARPEFAQVEAAFHYARTVSKFVPAKLKDASHDWLKDRNLPSGMDPAVVRDALVVGVKPVRLPVDVAKVAERRMGDSGAETMLAGGSQRDIRREMNRARVDLGLKPIPWEGAI